MVQTATLPDVVRGKWVPMTYAEFERWVLSGRHGEWWDGEGVIFVAPTEDQQWSALFLTPLVGTFAHVVGLGRAIIAPDEMRLREGARPEPDVLYVSAAHADRWRGQRLMGPADFVAEFISDWSVSHDRLRTFLECAAAGIPEYLMIDRRTRPGRFDFCRLNASGQYESVAPDAQGRYHAEAIPGFWLDPDGFWQDPLPNSLACLRRISPEAWTRLVQEVEREA
jgi:Uma2 family endonuclease